MSSEIIRTIYFFWNFILTVIFSKSFKPTAKPSILNKYGISQADFTYAVDLNLDKSWLDFYHEASYKIGSDFYLSLDLDSNLHVLNITKDIANEDVDKVVKIEELFTIWTGLCYKITPIHMTTPYVLHYLRIYFNHELLAEDLPMIDMSFTSEANSYGAIDLSWVDGKEFTIEVDPNFHLEYDVNLQTYTYKSLQLTSNCSSEDAYYLCISNL